jgi:thioredoxin reductase (NADPH)
MHDVIIVGAGAAGYTAGIYTSRYCLKNMILSQNDGGMGALAVDVENYPGFIQITGPELMKKFHDHAKHYGTEIHTNVSVEKIEKRGEGDFVAHMKDGLTHNAKSIILASGNKRRKLGLPSEDVFYGKGVSYCATCDGFFFRNKTVAVIGGGDAALTAVLHLSNIAKEVHLLYRRKKEDLRAEPFWIQKAESLSNVTFHFEYETDFFDGDTILKTITSKDKQTLDIDGCFIEIGAAPNVSWLSNLDLKLDDKNYIQVNNKAETSIPGIFAAGDVTNGSGHFEQFTTANGEAAVASNSTFAYIKAL